MNKKTTTFMIWLLALVPIALTIFCYSRLPQEIPHQWTVDGGVRYGSKNILWYLSALSLLVGPGFLLLPKIDPKRRNYEKFSTSYATFIIAVEILLTGLLGVIISESFHPGQISAEKVIVMGVGLLFAVIGNLMPKFKTNFFVGFKTPWTLTSEQVWFKTHRFGGMLWFGGGLLMVVCGLVLPEGQMMMWAILCIIAVIALWPTVMSYLWYAQLENKK